MMTASRFALFDAYYMFASLYHGGQGSKEYAIFGRLDRLGYKPGYGAQSQNPDLLGEDAREVFDRLVANSHLTVAKETLDQIARQKKTFARAARILEAAKNDADKLKDYTVRNHLECIELHEGYSEPGYSEPECGVIATGNWNDITRWNGTVHTIISNVPSRIAKLFEKMGIPTEWSDEWTTCCHCGKIVRTEPDSMSWTPYYIMGEGEIWCKDCDDTEDNETDDQS